MSRTFVGERTPKEQNGDAVNNTTVLKSMRKKIPVGSLLHLCSFRPRKKKIPNREEKLKRAQRFPVQCPHWIQTDVFLFWWQSSTDNYIFPLPSRDCLLSKGDSPSTTNALEVLWREWRGALFVLIKIHSFGKCKKARKIFWSAVSFHKFLF